MRVLLDTNVLVAAFLSRGNCAEVLKHCEARHDLVTSEALLRELHGALLRKGRCLPEHALRAAALLTRNMAIVEPEPLPQAVCRDADDDQVLAAARAGGCDCIVTGDGDLQVLGSYEGIEIVSPAGFWKFEVERG